LNGQTRGFFEAISRLPILPDFQEEVDFIADTILQFLPVLEKKAFEK